MEEDNKNLPQITEQLASPTAGGQQVSPVDYIYNSIKTKAAAPSLLEQIDSVKADADYFSSMFNSASGPDKVSFNEERINIDEAYTRLSGGSYITRYDEGFIKGADNENLYAQDQSTVSKWTNGLGKFVGKTANNVVGGTLGTVYGAISAIAEGNWERIYDNEFYDFLDDQNAKMDNFAANYRSQEERDMGFFESATTANFWADDFLGGMSFMTGTVVSESLWAAATGGTSLTTTAARVGLRASKYFNTTKTLVKGVKQAQKVARQYNRLNAIKNGASLAVKYGKTGELLNLARFTYTGAGFEAGMEARMYQKEQKENFNRDFENFNGRQPTAQEVAEFENNLGKTTNALWATNMALVGTSNFAILGKTFGVNSPFKLSGKRLDKALFGNGIKSTFGEAGERVATEAIKRNKFQRGLGFAKGVFKNPFYEGIVEEGGQATASNAFENYLTSRYNPSKDAMSLAESMYEGLSHTYGTKEGWKEVGLGMLIGLVGGEGTNALSGNGLFRDAREAGKEQDAASVEKAKIQNEHTGTNTVNKIFATRFEQNLNQATQIQNAQKEYDNAEKAGDVMGMATAQSKVMLSSLVSAVNLDYLSDQVNDFETALKMQSSEKLAEHYGIEENQVDSKITELVGQYKKMGEDYESAKEFADYVISDNPKELFDDATDVNVSEARGAIAYQMVMTGVIEENAEAAHEALVSSISELSPQLSSRYMQALNKFNQINKSKKEDVQAVARVEKRLVLKQSQLERLNKQLLKSNQIKSITDSKGNQKSADKYNKISNKITQLEEEISTISKELEEKSGLLASKKQEMSDLNASTRALANQLDLIDPLAGQDLVGEISIEETQKRLDELDTTLNKLQKTNPQLVERILKLGAEYKRGLTMWKRNADTLTDLTDPELGLKRIGTIIQKKKTAGATTLEFLKRLQQTNIEEQAFTNKINKLVNPAQEEETTTETSQEFSDNVSEQEKADNNKGEDTLQDNVETQTPVQSKIAELKATLKQLVGKNSFVLNNFSDNTQQLSEEKAPTQEELDEYQELRNKVKSGDINKLIGRPVDQISQRIKDRSGLTEQEISRYQDLSQKMVDWRVITGTNANGISVQDILNQIEAYKQEVQGIENIKTTAEEQVEIAQKASYEQGQINSDIGQTWTYVNVGNTSTHQEISHLSVNMLKELFDDNVNLIREENIGTEKEPFIVDIYEVQKEGEILEIQRTQDTKHRFRVANKNFDKFKQMSGLRTVFGKQKTAWGLFFKDGKLFESDYNLSKAKGETLNADLIYEQKPNSKIKFAISLKDSYNEKNIVPLLKMLYSLSKKEQKILERQIISNLAIYVQTVEGKNIALLKAGIDNKETNFNKIRDKAFKLFKEKYENNNDLESLVFEDSIYELPFETTVEKVFIGTPNLELKDDGSLKSFSLKQEYVEGENPIILDKGYSVKGKLNGKLTREKDNVRMTFIPQDRNVPYIIIRQGSQKIAYPVGLKGKNSNLLIEQLNEILNTEKRSNDKIVEVINFLRGNGIHYNPNFDLLLGNEQQELNKVYEYLNNSKISFTEKDISGMEITDFIANSEIVINLDKPAFVSPKIKMSLSKKLVNTKTGEASVSKSLTNEERQDLLIQNLVNTSKARTAEEVLKFVMETGNEEFIKEYLENSKFKNQVIQASLKNDVVPTINTENTLENLIQDVVDLSSTDIPLDIKEKFSQEVQSLNQAPTTAKVKSLAKKVIKATENRYKLVSASVNTSNMYHIPTTESEQQMFDQGYVRVYGDFYKKVDKKYNTQQLLEGLYNKYKNNNLPSHMTDNYLSLEDFIDQMPNTLLDVYKLYYNTQTISPVSKKAAIIGNDQYLREEFKGDFAEFIQQEKNKGSKLYKEVLKHFQITDKGILKEELLTRDKVDQFSTELGDNYRDLLNYSLINKHIDLQEQPQSVIFVEEIDNINRLEAVNNPNLIQPKAKATIINDKTISFTKVNKLFIQYKDGVYEKVHSNKQGDYVYERIATVNPDFIITEVAAPFSTATIEINKEIDRTKANINKTEGKKIDC